MTTIENGSSLLTLINVFTVEPDKQQQLVSLLIEATEKTMRNLPGFLSANIHPRWKTGRESRAMGKHGCF